MLAQVLAFCREHDCMLNVEIKPAPGDEVRTGRRCGPGSRRWSASPLRRC